jgi:hypothetical protein
MFYYLFIFPGNKSQGKPPDTSPYFKDGTPKILHWIVVDQQQCSKPFQQFTHNELNMSLIRIELRWGG